MNSKQKTAVIFTDLDGTLNPLNLEVLGEFLDFVKKTQKEEGIKIKVCPVSGRQSSYVLGQMHMLRDIFKSSGVEKVFDYGVGEQGAIVVDGNDSTNEKYIGKSADMKLKEKVAKIIEKNRFSRYLVDEGSKIHTCSIHIKKKIQEKLSLDERKKIYTSINEDVKKALGDKVNTSMSHNCLEVMTKEISKANGIEHVISELNKTHEVAGISYAGDAGNDKVAIEHFTKLAEIGGVKANIYTPSNAQEVISSKNLEAWKNKNPYASKNRIKKAEYPNWKGVLSLMKKDVKSGEFYQKDTKTKIIKDDMVLELNRNNDNRKRNALNHSMGI